MAAPGEGIGRRTDIPSLSKKDAQEEEEQGDAGADPSVQHKGRRLVQEGLVMLVAALMSARGR